MHELFSVAMLDVRRKLEDLELGGETGGLFRIIVCQLPHSAESWSWLCRETNGAIALAWPLQLPRESLLGFLERCSWSWLLEAFVFVHVLLQVLPTK